MSTTAPAKIALRALAHRWLILDAEIKEHEAVLEHLVREQAPALMEAPSVSTAAATAGRTPPCTASRLSGCGIIRRPANTSSAEPPKANQPVKSDDA